VKTSKLQAMRAPLSYRQALYLRSEREAQDQIYRLAAFALIALHCAGYLFVCAA